MGTRKAMRQTRIERFYPSQTRAQPPPSRVSFLDLPRHVRRQIYHNLGIVPETDGVAWPLEVFNLPTVAAEKCQVSPDIKDPATYYHVAHPDSEPCTRDCDGWKDPWQCPERYCLPVQLFLVSRSISDDARCFFYSTYPFQVAHTAPGGLSRLIGLGSVPTAALRYLTLRMNMCMCPYGENCKDWTHTSRAGCHSVCRTAGHDAPLGFHRGSRNDKNLLAELKRACQHLARHIPPDSLRLTFVCDCVDYDTATEALKPLSLLPKLQWCSIALSHTFDKQLRDLAETTRLRLTGHPESRITTPFPFRDLPKELQLEVLRRTGLIAERHLQYGPKPRGLFNPAPFNRHGCVYEAHYLDNASRHLCCCRGHAHSISSWSCSCWHFPVALLTVDREMRRDALEIMYQDNVWALDRCCFDLAMKKMEATLPVPMFFLDHVRNLTLDLRTSNDPDYFLDLGPLHQPWKPILTRLVERHATELITLTMIIPGYKICLFTDRERGDNLWCDSVDFLYARLKSRVFADFFIFIEDIDAVKIVGDSEPDTFGIAEGLEKLVMGDTYDSIGRGKATKLHVWLPSADDLKYLVCVPCGINVYRP